MLIAIPQPHVRVDEGSTGFFEGRQFRTFIDLNIPKGGTLWMRFTIGTNFTLHDQRVSLESGAVRWSAVAGTSSSPGPWAPSIFRPRNQMTNRPTPFYVSTASIETSNTAGAAVGGADVDVMRVSAAGSRTQNAGLRGLPTGVYHVKMTNTSKEDVVGVYDWWWEEIP